MVRQNALKIRYWADVLGWKVERSRRGRDTFLFIMITQIV